MHELIDTEEGGVRSKMSEKIKADLIIIGGGMAGVTAAIAASRGGVNVLLVEKGGYFGGTATGSVLGELNGYTHHGQKIYGGITAEIIDNMLTQGFAHLRYSVPMTGNPSIVVDRVRYEPERLKIFFDEMLIREKVTFLLHSALDRIEEGEGGSTYKVYLTNGYECVEVEGSIVIDASGNAEVVYKANKPTWKPSKQEAQAVSLIFRMGGIDAAAYQRFPLDELRKMILAGNEQGFLPAKYCAINLIAETNDAIINMTRISEVDHESMADMTKAEIEGRKQISKAIPYLRTYPGFEKAYLSGIAPSLGIREARRIIGRYTLTQEDILSGKKFTDAVAIGCYPMDIHGKKNQAVEFTAIGGDGIYTIPFSSLLPNEMERVIAAGKCISVDSGAFSAIRTMPTVMAIGEAAGTAAGLSIRHKVPPHRLPVIEIQRVLKKGGHLLE